ncbi:MAG: DUF2946 family protein [Sphingomonadaceae bacterium]|nr:DUF2946 family protein [Sphingomonadaceae bacterium]
MARFRSFLIRRPWLALALAVLALAVRVAVPAGTMPATGGLVICSGHGAKTRMAPSAPAKPADKGDAPCAFTGLLAAAMDAPALPALLPPSLVAVVLALAALTSVVLAPRRLWPPRRGPPAEAFA